MESWSMTMSVPYSAFGPPKDGQPNSSPPQTPQRLLKPKEIASRLAVDVKKIYRLIDAGELPAYKLGGEWRFDWDEVVLSLRRNTPDGSAEAATGTR